MSKSTNNNWKGFEELIHKIYKELEPIADVKINDMIIGSDTQIPRQIDVSIKSNIASHEILIIVQAKTEKRKIDINKIGEFSAVLKDVRASKGILICNSGFTKSAKEYAKRLGIDICTAHSAENINWQTEIQIPVIKNNIKIKLKFKLSYAVVSSIPISELKPPFPTMASRIFIEKWEKNELNKEPGVHILELNRKDIDISKDLLPIKSEIEYTIIHRHHFKYFIPSDYRGIKDYLTSTFTPSFMSFNEKIPFLNDGTWKFILNPNEIPFKSLHLNIEILDIDILKSKMIRFNWEQP